MKQIRWITMLLLMASTSMAQIPSLERIEPANWWVKMQQPFLQLIVHGNKIAERDVKLEYPGVTLLKVNKVENPNYLFLDLNIDPSTAPGTFPIRFLKKGSKDLVFSYELKARNTGTKAQ
ncbi:MAG: alpha amylase catalytic region, partial [Bacteroidetes bacterium]|nr:alpha amylase catalytic region [Bacteroidota bacterium]